MERHLEYSDRLDAQDERTTIALETLSPFDRIIATTMNHEYEIIVVSPCHYTVLLRGGNVTEFASGCVLGSSAGNAALKAGTIAVGLRMQLALGERRIITSAVQSLALVPAGSPQRAEAA